MSKKITPQSEAHFVTSLMDVDLNKHINDWTNSERLEYLKIIGDYTDEVGEKIIRTDSLGEGPTTIGRDVKTRIGEDRPELDDGDIDLDDIVSVLQQAMPGAHIINMNDPGGRAEYVPPRVRLFDEIFNEIKPPDYKGMNLIEFIRSGDCLSDDEAKVWLYKNKIPHECEHIHTYPYEMCMFLPDEDQGTEKLVTWISSKGELRRDDMMTAIMTMFSDYVELECSEEILPNG